MGARSYSDIFVGFVVYSQLIFVTLIAMGCLRPMACDIGLGIIPAAIIGIPMLTLYKTLHPLLGQYAGLVPAVLAASVMLFLTKMLVKSSNYVRVSSILLLLALIILSGA